ncbi:transcription factor FapR [Alicyclobacillus mengziensis]|uniref:transcription factor FapR n=1 Tax=Alicyclobacillus mengziensis TaxID=2931921 RepID=UPI00201217C4|nr:transcription factor FapR [Alicyclobacillus mengziensis]
MIICGCNRTWILYITSKTARQDAEGGRLLKKSDRRLALVNYLTDNPFATDEQLAERFGVSVPTIRLDRAVLQIPEARERIRRVAAGQHDSVRALAQEEVLGEITELQLDRYAVSILEVQPAHAFRRTSIVRGHVLFGQLNSLAVAVTNADVALTAKTELRFHRSVSVGETVVGRVDVVARRFGVTKCRTVSTCDSEVVVDGTIWVVQATEAYAQR